MSINVKQLAAEKAVEFVKDGMKIGLGTGSTAYWAINRLGERVSEGLKITAVATSRASEEQARELGIPIVAFGDIDSLDLTIDGADELDSSLQLIKGGGGALLREKIVASNSTRMIVIADESKVVNTLGKFPLPVEIVPLHGNGLWLNLPSWVAILNCVVVEKSCTRQITAITSQTAGSKRLSPHRSWHWPSKVFREL